METGGGRKRPKKNKNGVVWDGMEVEFVSGSIVSGCQLSACFNMIFFGPTQTNIKRTVLFGCVIPGRSLGKPVVLAMDGLAGKGLPSYMSISTI